MSRKPETFVPLDAYPLLARANRWELPALAPEKLIYCEDVCQIRQNPG